jgi:hypothetical protein
MLITVYLTIESTVTVSLIVSAVESNESTLTESFVLAFVVLSPQEAKLTATIAMKTKINFFIVFKIKNKTN